MAEATGAGSGVAAAEVDVGARQVHTREDGRHRRAPGAVDPKNRALAIGAAASLAHLGASGSEATAGIIVFVVLASVSIAAPVVLFRAGGDKAAHVLDGWKAWLSVNNAAVMAVLFVVFGVVLFSQGLSGRRPERRAPPP